MSKRVNVEVNISDLDLYDYYIDERSKKLEKLLRNDTRFGYCRVKREHWGGDGDDDPFVIQDDEGFDLITLETLQVNTLSESELLSYIDVEIKHLECSENHIIFLLGIIVLLPVAVSSIVMMIIYNTNINLSLTFFLTSVVICFMLLFGVMYYTRRNTMIASRRQIDLKAAQEDSTFLSAIKKLATAPDTDEWDVSDYKRRLEYIEDVVYKL